MLQALWAEGLFKLSAGKAQKLFPTIPTKQKLWDLFFERPETSGPPTIYLELKTSFIDVEACFYISSQILLRSIWQFLKAQLLLLLGDIL